MAEIEIGKHCEENSCHQLDFLPIKCSHCGKTFCKIHSSTAGHKCENFSETIKTFKKFVPPETTKCFMEKCDKVVMTKCPICQLDFCLDHRLEIDHKCSKAQWSTIFLHLEINFEIDKS